MDELLNSDILVHDIETTNIMGSNIISSDEFEHRIKRCRNIDELVKVRVRCRNTFANNTPLSIVNILLNCRHYDLLANVIRRYRNNLLRYHRILSSLIKRNPYKRYVVCFLVNNNVLAFDEYYNIIVDEEQSKG